MPVQCCVWSIFAAFTSSFVLFLTVTVILIVITAIVFVVTFWSSSFLACPLLLPSLWLQLPSMKCNCFCSFNKQILFHCHIHLESAFLPHSLFRLRLFIICMPAHILNVIVMHTMWVADRLQCLKPCFHVMDWLLLSVAWSNPFWMSIQISFLKVWAAKKPRSALGIAFLAFWPLGEWMFDPNELFILVKVPACNCFLTWVMQKPTFQTWSHSTDFTAISFDSCKWATSKLHFASLLCHSVDRCEHPCHSVFLTKIPHCQFSKSAVIGNVTFPFICSYCNFAFLAFDVWWFSGCTVICGICCAHHLVCCQSLHCWVALTFIFLAASLSAQLFCHILKLWQTLKVVPKNVITCNDLWLFNFLWLCDHSQTIPQAEFSLGPWFLSPRCAFVMLFLFLRLEFQWLCIIFHTKAVFMVVCQFWIIETGFTKRCFVAVKWFCEFQSQFRLEQTLLHEWLHWSHSSEFPSLHLPTSALLLWNSFWAREFWIQAAVNSGSTSGRGRDLQGCECFRSSYCAGAGAGLGVQSTKAVVNAPTHTSKPLSTAVAHKNGSQLQPVTTITHHPLPCAIPSLVPYVKEPTTLNRANQLPSVCV